MGELEFFKSHINSPPRSHRWSDINRRYTSGFTPDPTCTAIGGVADYEVGSDEVYTTTYSPYGAVLSKEFLDSFATSELAFCRELSSHHAFRLFKNINPHRREYSLARNIAELKDLPRSIISAQRTADDLKKLWTSMSSTPKLRSKVFDLSHNAAQNIPSEYLSYHFGWKQLYKDLKDLLELPEKLSKRINFLMKRSGKPTTLRANVSSLSGTTDTSGFVYDVDDQEFLNIPSGGTFSRIERKCETRLVINAVFDFPTVNTPRLRTRFFLDKVGLIPRFTDVYNIIPWSWLVDWFTGFGNYLELIEEINHDHSLINWGMITTHTEGKLISEFRSVSPTFRRTYVNNSQTVDAVESVFCHHTSILEYECQTRQNVSNVLDVKETTIPSSLTAYQLSILGAILAQRIDNTRSGAFRPRS